MDICRVCLASKPSKDIDELTTNTGNCQSYADIFLFCLDIQVISIGSSRLLWLSVVISCNPIKFRGVLDLAKLHGLQKTMQKMLQKNSIILRF